MVDRQATGAFAQEFREQLEREGVAILDRYNWVERLSELGFQMDCGRSYKEMYGLELGEAKDAEKNIAGVDNARVLGNAIFSQCRYLTHWANGYDEEATVWLVAALRRLETLCTPKGTRP